MKIFSTQRSPISKTALHFGQFLGFATFSSGESDMCMIVSVEHGRNAVNRGDTK